MSRTQKKEKAPTPARSGKRTWIVGAVIGGVVALAAIVAVTTAGDPSETQPTVAPIDVVATGQTLPALTDPLSDPAAGAPAPTLTGPALIGGGGVEIAPNGQPTVVVFVAHWCSHCQAEVPRIVALDEAGDTEGVRLLAVATANDPSRPNYPPSGWLQSEGWPTPVLLDDNQATAASAFGVSGFPFIAVLDGAGNVVLRTSGELGDQGLRQVFEIARAAGSSG